MVQPYSLSLGAMCAAIGVANRSKSGHIERTLETSKMT
jgi:hypothetical protein